MVHIEGFSFVVKRVFRVNLVDDSKRRMLRDDKPALFHPMSQLDDAPDLPKSHYLPLRLVVQRIRVGAVSLVQSTVCLLSAWRQKGGGVNARPPSILSPQPWFRVPTDERPRQ